MQSWTLKNQPFFIKLPYDQFHRKRHSCPYTLLIAPYWRKWWKLTVKVWYLSVYKQQNKRDMLCKLKIRRYFATLINDSKKTMIFIIDQTRVSSSLSRTFLELAFLFTIIMFFDLMSSKQYSICGSTDHCHPRNHPHNHHHYNHDCHLLIF